MGEALAKLAWPNGHESFQKQVKAQGAVFAASCEDFNVSLIDTGTLWIECQ